MKVLLDEMLPQSVADRLVGHEVSTVAREGWKGLQNGVLLRHAAERQFQVLITADQNMEHQQDLSALSLRVVVVPVQTMPELVPLVPRILEALSSAAAGVVRV